MGELGFYGTVVRSLVNRLQVEDWYRRHPETHDLAADDERSRSKARVDGHQGWSRHEGQANPQATLGYGPSGREADDDEDLERGQGSIPGLEMLFRSSWGRGCRGGCLLCARRTR